MKSCAWTILSSSLLLAAVQPVAAQESWPAESIDEAVNLTPLAGPGINDFHFDLSGACHDPAADRTWICRNGPWPDSKVWSLIRTPEGSWEIERQNGEPCEWTGFGDLEGLTVVDAGSSRILGVVEGPDRLREYDLSIPGEVVLLHEWDISSWTDANGGYGAEGITFVPDFSLSAGDFVDRDGLPRTAIHGLGGLVFVGHQQGGFIHVFDLDRSDDTVDFVGRYATSRDETCGLEFDPSTGLLYAWHDAGHDELEVLGLASDEEPGGDRRLQRLAIHAAPFNGSVEGMAISPGSTCVGGQRDLLLTADDGGFESLFHFRAFTSYCDQCPADLDGDLKVDAADLGLLLADWGCTDSLRDVNQDGLIDGADLGLLIGGWGRCP